MKILLTGSNGQLGCSIKERFKDTHITLNAFSKIDLDITNKKQIAVVIKELKPNIIINAAANTDVDNAEKYPDKAFSINQHGAQNIGMVSKDYNIPLIHISTDFVFDGNKKDGYLENDTKNPINSYGLSKHRGEEEIIGLASQFIIIRTSWIFSEFGKNFLKTIYQNIKLGKKLKIVSDQVGCPTYAYDIAEFIFTLTDSLNSSCVQNEIYHFAGSDSCSWYEFANLINQVAFNEGLVEKDDLIEPIESSAYKGNIALRPKYSILNSNKAYNYFSLTPTKLQNAILKSILSIENDER